jgi:hypothetical protein
VHTGNRRADAVNNLLRRVAGWNLRSRGIQIKLSRVGGVLFSDLQRNSSFHARRRAPPLHFQRQVFENTKILAS